MHIRLSPNNFPDERTLDLIKTGDALAVNGETFDFSSVGDGDTLPATAIASGWFPADVERISGELIITLWLPNPWNASPEQRFPDDLVNVPDGPVMLPQPLPISEEQKAERNALLTMVEQIQLQQGGVQ